MRLHKGDFIGRDAAQRILGEPAKWRLCILALGDGDVVGRLTSGGYMFHVKQSVGLGYVRSECANESSGLETEILGRRRAARVLKEAPYDPEGKRLRT